MLEETTVVEESLGRVLEMEQLQKKNDLKVLRVELGCSAWPSFRSLSLPSAFASPARPPRKEKQHLSIHLQMEKKETDEKAPLLPPPPLPKSIMASLLPSPAIGEEGKGCL